MKRIICFIALLLMMPVSRLLAQGSDSAPCDRIVGCYEGSHSGEVFKVKVFKQKDGLYTAQVYWVEHDRDEHGRKILDAKNPDHSLRKVPCDRIVLFAGASYDATHKRWVGAKIYDPTRGLRAKLTAHFEPDGRLALRGTLLGISETVHWKRIDCK